MSSPEQEVRAASARFYAGLNRMANGDASPLADIWSHDADATTLHPIGGREVGWGKVQESFNQVAQVASGGQIRLDDQVVHVMGEVACEAGMERGTISLVGKAAAIDHRVTNIYRKEAGHWKIIHHHADLSPAMLAIFKELTAKA